MFIVLMMEGSTREGFHESSSVSNLQMLNQTESTAMVATGMPV